MSFKDKYVKESGFFLFSNFLCYYDLLLVVYKGS